MPARRRARSHAATISIDQKTSDGGRDGLLRVFRGEPKDGYVPTLEQRIRAAIALAPYSAPRIRGIAPNEPPIGVGQMEDVTRLGDQHLLMEHYLRLVRSPPPRTTPAKEQRRGEAVGELPHEFLARVGRGEQIDGYLPPQRLQRIAAAAALIYYSARLPSVELEEADERLEQLAEEIKKREAGLSSAPDPEAEYAAALEMYKEMMDGRILPPPKVWIRPDQ